MSAQIASPSPEIRLHHILRRWDRRLRLVQSLAWLPRALALALVVGIVLALISRTRPWLLPENVLTITGLLLAFGSILALLIVWFYPRSPLTIARRFDRTLVLRERTSTAFELLNGSIRANDELMQHQIEDALVHAGAVKASDYLPLRPRWQDWGLLLALAGVMILLLIAPNPQADQAAASNAQQTAIEDAAQNLRDITRDIAADPDLGDEQRRELLEALQSSIDILEQPDVTPEEAFAAISDAQTALQQNSDQLQQQASTAQAALGEAADALRQLPSVDATQDQSLSEMLDQLGGQAGSFDSPQRGMTADQLDAAADVLEESDPSLAQALRDAANALRNEQAEAAQSQLQQARDQASQAEQQAQQQQQQGTQLGQQADQAQQSGAQVGQQSSQRGTQGQQGQPGQQGQQPSSQSGDQSGDGQGQPQSSSQTGSESGSSANPSQASGQNGAVQQGQSGGDQGTQGGGQQQGAASGSPSTTNQQSNAASSGMTGTGAGDDPGGAGQDGGGTQSNGQQVPQTNNPDGAGETPFESVYAPTRLGNDGGGPTIELEPDMSDVPVQEGDFAENPTGSSTVPYDQVYTDYADSANRALESDYVPLGLQDVVRDYFTGLEPGQGGR